MAAAGLSSPVSKMRNVESRQPTVFRPILAIVLAANVTSLLACDFGSSQRGATTTAAAVKQGGLHASDSDPRVVALAKKALACAWIDGSFEYTCKEFKKWQESKLLKDGKADKTLLNLLEDRDEKIRFLAAQALNKSGREYRTDPQLARRLVAVAKAETSEHVASDLGSAVGKLNTKLTGLELEVKGLIKNHRLNTLRQQLAANVLITNQGFYEFMLMLATEEKDKDVRRAVVSAFWVGTPFNKTDDVCALWLRVANTEQDPIIAGEAAYSCSFWSRGCTKQWDGLLGGIKKKALAGQVQSDRMAGALKHLHEQKKTSAEQKQQALQIARTLVENSKNLESARARALDFIAEKDPAAKEFAAKFTDDEQPLVRLSADRALKANP